MVGWRPEWPSGCALWLAERLRNFWSTLNAPGSMYWLYCIRMATACW
jgi:hypothetical protein